MTNRRTCALAGLFALCLLPGIPAEELAMAPDETAVAEDAGRPAFTLAGDLPDEAVGEAGHAGAETFADRLRVRAHVLYDAYRDLEVSSRSVKQNDLGLAFAQPSVGAQNDAEQKSWWAATEMLELAFDLLNEGPHSVWVFVGAGCRQSEQDFGTGTVEVKGPPIGVYSAGLQGNFGEIASGVRLDWEARFTYANSDTSTLDEVAGAAEEIETEIMTYAARVVAVFDPAIFAPCSELEGGVRLQPYLGVLYHHLDGSETYTASSTSGVVGTSEFEFDIRSKASSDVRALGGLRLLGLHETATVDLEGSVGSGSYGAGLVVNIRF